MKNLLLIIFGTLIIVSCEKDESESSIITSNSIASINNSCNLFLENPISTIESTFNGHTTCSNPTFNTCFGVRMGRVLRTEFNRRRSQLGQFIFREIIATEQVGGNGIHFIPLSEIDGVEPNIDIIAGMPVDIANKIYEQTACDIHTHYDSLPELTDPNQGYFLNITDIALNVPFGSSETDNVEYSISYSIEKRTYGN